MPRRATACQPCHSIEQVKLERFISELTALTNRYEIALYSTLNNICLMNIGGSWKTDSGYEYIIDDVYIYIYI